jgi:hypothetical protein
MTTIWKVVNEVVEAEVPDAIIDGFTNKDNVIEDANGAI